MKKFILTLLITFTFNASAQYTIMSAVQLNEGQEEQYLALEEWEKANPGWELDEDKSLERCKIINSLLGVGKKLEIQSNSHTTTIKISVMK